MHVPGVYDRPRQTGGPVQLLPDDHLQRLALLQVALHGKKLPHAVLVADVACSFHYFRSCDLCDGMKTEQARCLSVGFMLGAQK